MKHIFRKVFKAWGWISVLPDKELKSRGKISWRKKEKLEAGGDVTRTWEWNKKIEHVPEGIWWFFKRNTERMPLFETRGKTLNLNKLICKTDKYVLSYWIVNINGM